MIINNPKTLCFYVLLFCLASFHAKFVMASNSAIFLVYHRFGQASSPSTNTTLKQLEQHIEELKAKKYNVLPVGEIIKKIKSGSMLRDRTIGITIDDGYKSIYTKV